MASGRVLPGSTPEELVGEVAAIVGSDVAIEIASADLPPTVNQPADLPPELERALREVDPDAIAVPMLLPGATDGRWLATAGIPHYGFTPLRVPPDLPLLEMTHSVNERITVEALEFGTEVYRRLFAMRR